MLGDINFNIESIEYRLILCHKNKEPIGEISDYTSFVYNPVFASMCSQLSFSLHKNINGEVNNLFDKISSEKILLLKVNDVDEGYFTISSDRVTESINEVINVTGMSIEFELNKKKVNAIKGTYKISEIFALTFGKKARSWSLGTIHSSLQTVYRTFDISETSLLDFMYSNMQTSYDCIVKFNTLDKTVNFHSKDEFTNKSKLIIAYDTVAKSISRKMQDDKIVTRLKVNGKDNLSINSVNPTGRSTIDNFDYFKPFMSASLSNALTTYENLVASKEGDFESYLVAIDNYNKQLVGYGDVYIDSVQSASSNTITLANTASEVNGFYVGHEILIVLGTGRLQQKTITGYVGSTKVATVDSSWSIIPDNTSDFYIREKVGKDFAMSLLLVDMALINNNIDTSIAAELEYSSLNIEKSAKQVQIDAKQAEMTAIDASIQSVLTSISNLAILLDEDNNFTVDQLKELDDFTYEDSYKNEGYAINEDVMSFQEQLNVRNALYQDGLKKIDSISQPRFTLEISLIDFLKLKEYQHNRDDLKLGYIVKIEYQEGSFLDARIMQYNHQESSNSLTLTLSNAYNIDDNTYSLADMIQKTYNTKVTLDIERDGYNAYGEAADAISSYMSRDFSASNQRIIATYGVQEVIIDERGIWLREKIVDGEGNFVEYKPKQLRIFSNVIAFSVDGFITSRLAITADGINGLAIQDGTLDISNFFTAPEGIVEGLTVEHLRTKDIDGNDETTNFIDIFDKRMSCITGQRLYWTNSSMTVKATTATAYPTRDIQSKAINGSPLWYKHSENAEDSMTVVVNDYPVFMQDKTGILKLFYTDETTSSTSSTPTLVTITTPDAIEDEQYYIPKMIPYLISGQQAYWKTKPVISNLETDFPVVEHQYAQYEKLKIGFVGDGNAAHPQIIMGTGYGSSLYPERGKFFIDKDTTGGILKYIKADGTVVQIKLGENGIEGAGSASSPLTKLDFYANGFNAEYDSEEVGYRWTKDGTGKITQLENVYTSEVVPVVWNGGNI